jgi:methionyl aminopeptidase
MKNALALKENSKVIARRGVIELKTPSEISRMRDAGKILAEVFEVLRSRVSGGITTKALDHIAFTEIKKRGAAPAFLNYNGYPAVICASINEEVVHGLPAASRVV